LWAFNKEREKKKILVSTFNVGLSRKGGYLDSRKKYDNLIPPLRIQTFPQELDLQRLLTYMLQGYINSCLSIKVMENSPLLIYV